MCEFFSVADLESSSGFSKHHFSRLFHLVTGYTLSEYIRNRRLTEAAKKLTQTGDKIIDIAFMYQFSSQEAFTRAFVKLFDITPGKYRKIGKKVKFFSPLNVDNIIWLQGGIEMKPVIKYLEPKKIVGLVYEGDNGKQEIGSIWQELMIRLDEIQHKVGDMNAYGLCAPLFDHIEDFDLMQQNTFMYLAGVEVTDFEALPEGMTSWHVTHEKYAVFKHVGPLDQISETFKAIYMKWLPESGHEVVKGYDFELYDEHFNPMDENPVTYLYIPIQ